MQSCGPNVIASQASDPRRQRKPTWRGAACRRWRKSDGGFAFGPAGGVLRFGVSGKQTRNLANIGITGNTEQAQRLSERCRDVQQLASQREVQQ